MKEDGSFNSYAGAYALRTDPFCAIQARDECGWTFYSRLCSRVTQSFLGILETLVVEPIKGRYIPFLEKLKIVRWWSGFKCCWFLNGNTTRVSWMPSVLSGISARHVYRTGARRPQVTIFFGPYKRWPPSIGELGKGELYYTLSSKTDWQWCLWVGVGLCWGCSASYGRYGDQLLWSWNIIRRYTNPN